MRTYLLRTDRIEFSHWTHADIKLANMMFGDPGVARYIIAGGRFSEEQIRDRLQLEIDNEANYGVSYWPMFALESGEFLGNCGLRPYEIDNKVYEMGYHLMRDHWGKGYATEAGRAVVDYAFNTLGVRKLIAGHHPDNANSGKVLLKLGFQRVGEVLYPPTGLMHPTYELTRTVPKAMISLIDIADKLDETMECWEQYLNTATCEFVALSDGTYVEADEVLAEEIENSHDYIRLPNQREIREYEIMEDFAESTPNVTKQERLFQALNGRKPFRHFKDTLNYIGLTDAYYAFRHLAFLRIAREWCEDNGIQYRKDR